MLALYAIAVLALAWLVHRLFLHPLSHVPGPFISKLIPLYYIRMIHTGSLIFTLKELHDKYGPVVRLGPSDLSFATISAFESIHGFAADKGFTIAGSRRTLLADKSLEDVMLSSCISKEARNWLRPIITSTLNEMTGTCSERLFDAAFTEGLKLHQVGQPESTSTNLSVLHNDYMWDLGSLMAFGKHPKPFTRGKFDVLIDDFERFMCFLEICFCFVNRVTVQRYRTAFFKVWRFCNDFIGMPTIEFGDDEQSHISFEDNHYARLKAATKKAGKDDIGEIFLQANSYSTKLSVYGTSDTAMNTIFYYLLKNPRCLKKVEEELLSTFQSYSEVTDARLATLPYLNACINESHRVAPPFNAAILQRVSKGTTVDGLYIPPGTSVQVDQYSLGNSEEHWESASSFLPERWLDSTLRKNEKASRPFLIGPRQCPGRQMELQILRLAVGKTLYLYQMDWINKDFDISLHSSSCLSWTNIKLNVTMKPRVPGVLGY